MITQEVKHEVMQAFRKRKTLTVEQLKNMLQCSVPGVRKYLKQWKTVTSYNCNGRYYALPDVPQFNEYGLWEHNEVRFSRFGTLKETIIQIVMQSPQGLSSTEIGSLLGLDPRSFMNHYKDLPQLQRIKLHGRYVYLSNDKQTGKLQQEHREEAIAAKTLQQISDHDAVTVFTDFIKHPETTMENRVNRLQKQGVSVNAQNIRALLQFHGLSEKKTLQPDS